MNALALVLLATPVLSAPSQETAKDNLHWYGDIDEARRVAAAQGKHVLVSFTGTGWCSWCKKLDTEVLGTRVFGEAALSRFVLVEADFDREGNARDDLPHAAKNDALKSALGVTGFPKIVLMTSGGVGYATLGYERGGAGPYVTKLLKEQRKAHELEVAVPKATAAVATAKSKEEALGAAAVVVELLRGAGPHVLGRPLVPIVRATLSGIPVSAATPVESEREAQAILALAGANVVDDELIERAFRVDPENRAGLPEATLAAAMRSLAEPSAVEPLIRRAEAMLSTLIVHDPQVAAQLYGDCAYWIKNWQHDSDRARIMAAFALRLDPVDENLRNMLRDLAGK